MADILCPACGRANAHGARFCMGCGSAVPEAHPSTPEQLEPSSKRLSLTAAAAVVMVVLCAGSLWLLLKPQSGLSATSFFKPSSFSCTFTSSDPFGADSGDVYLRIDDLGWTAGGSDSDGNEESFAGLADYNADSDTLTVSGEGFPPISVRGFSALTFTGSGATVRLQAQQSDAYGDDSGALELQIRPEGLSGNGRLQTSVTASGTCTTDSVGN